MHIPVFPLTLLHFSVLYNKQTKITSVFVSPCVHSRTVEFIKMRVGSEFIY